MKIVKADVFRTSVCAPDLPFVEKIWHPIGIRIYTDEGIYGDGELALAYGTGGQGGVGMLKDFVPMIIGMDPMDNEVIWNKLHRETFWGQNGGPIVFAAIAAIDMALWDIRGKALGVPVYKLLGGKMQNELRCYASQLQGGWRKEAWKAKGSTKSLVDTSLEAIDEGYDAIKIDFLSFYEDADMGKGIWHDIPFSERKGMLSAELLDLLESRVAAVREAIGPKVDLIIENHSSIDAEGAIQFGRRVEKYNIFYFEEPNTPSPYTAKRIHDAIRIPLAHGERVYTRWQYNQYFENGSLAVIQPDMGNTGGITETKKICDMAHSYDVGVQLHVCASPLSTAAALQVECTLPNFVIHEHHLHAIQDYNNQLGKYAYQPVDGKYTIPDLPGLGEEWSEFAIKNAELITIK